MLHSLLVCHLPLSTTWLACFLSLIYFFSISKAPLLKKKKENKQNWNIGALTFPFSDTTCRITRTRVRGRKHHISITLHSRGCHAIRAVIAVVIWVMRMRKTWCSPFNAVRHILTCRHPRHYRKHWLKLSWGHPQRGVQRRKRQLQSKLTSCLSYWLLKTVHKRGGKTAMFLPSMVQSAFPDWGHTNVELSLGTVVTKKKKKKESTKNLCFLWIFRC